MDIIKDKTFQKKINIKAKNIDTLSINSLFNLEKRIVNYINELEDKNKELDITYLNYFNLKKQINNAITNEKNFLIEIINQKSKYAIDNKKTKLEYLKKEYTTLLYQTSTSTFIKKSKNLEEKIILVSKHSNMDGLDLKLYEIKQKRNKIIKLIKQNNNKNNNIYSKLNIDKKIYWYETQIEQMTQNQMIFDNYIFNLENLYKDIIQKRMLDITFIK